MAVSVLLVDESQCVECSLCALACSLVKTDTANVKMGRVHSRKRWPQAPAIEVCRHWRCEGKWCIDSCPTVAIELRDEVLVIEPALCNGCGECVPACPYGAIFIEELEWKALACDLCAGNPACVPACPTEALLFGENSHAD